MLIGTEVYGSAGGEDQKNLRSTTRCTMESVSSMAQTPRKLPLDFAIGDSIGPVSAYALLVLRPEGDVHTYVSDSVQTSPNRLFSRPLREQFLRACDAKSEGYARGAPSQNVESSMGSEDDLAEERGQTQTRKRPRTRNSHAVAPASTSKVQIALHNRQQLRNFYVQCFGHFQQGGCKVLAKAWVKLVEPRKQSNHPYTGKAKTAPKWWPPTNGPNAIRHREPDHLKKPERLILCTHILEVLLDPDHPCRQEQPPRSERPAIDAITIQKLEDHTWEAMAGFFSLDQKNESKRVYLEEIFRVAKLEEKYRRGALDPNAIVLVTHDARAGQADSGEDDTQQRQLSNFPPSVTGIATPDSTVSPDVTSMDAQMRPNMEHNDMFNGYNGFRDIPSKQYSTNLPPTPEDQGFADSQYNVSNAARYMARPPPAGYHSDGIGLQETTRRASWHPSEYTPATHALSYSSWVGQGNMGQAQYAPYTTSGGAHAATLPLPQLPPMQHQSYEENMYQQYEPNGGHPRQVLRTGSLSHPHHIIQGQHSFQDYLHESSSYNPFEMKGSMGT